MQLLTIQKRTDFTKPAPQTYAPNPWEVVTGDVVLREPNGTVVGCSVALPGEHRTLPANLARELRFKTKWDDVSVSSSQSRMSGIRTVSRVFGYTGPKPLRRRYGGSVAMLHRDNPRVGTMLEALTSELWELFAETAPEAATVHLALVRAKVRDDWWFGGAPWTSGVINNASLLPYHRDSGNIAGTWSAMLCLRRGVSGGHLTLPEYDLTLEIPNGSVTIFNGQQVWHGVTPMTLSGSGYRMTLVWYAKSDVAGCGPMKDEPRRAALAATERTKRNEGHFE